jgi:hypothetical protein
LKRKRKLMRITPFIIWAFGVTTFSLMIFSIMTFSIMTFSITTLITMDLIVTLSKKDTLYNDTLHKH